MCPALTPCVANAVCPFRKRAQHRPAQGLNAKITPRKPVPKYYNLFDRMHTDNGMSEIGSGVSRVLYMELMNNRCEYCKLY